MKIIEILNQKKQQFNDDVAEVTQKMVNFLETRNSDCYTEGFRIEYIFTDKRNSSSKIYGNTLFQIPCENSSYKKKVYQKALSEIASNSDGMITFDAREENILVLTIKPLF